MRRFFLLLLALLLVMGAVPAFAALDNSHHDMTKYLQGNSGLTQKDKCFFCHGIKDSNAASAMGTKYGKIGPFCLARCHSGSNTILSNPTGLQPQGPRTTADNGATWTSPTADYLIVAFDNAHADNITAVKNTNLAATTVGTSNLPYTTGAGTTKIECTSCHSVHDNANAPFVWFPLYSATGSGNQICEKCHAERATNALSANPAGMHPVNFVFSAAAAATRSGATQSGYPDRHPRNIAIDWTGNVFDVASSYLPADLDTSTEHYTTGGHLGGFATVATAGQQMGCYTCHAAHQPGSSGMNNLVVAPLTDGAPTTNPLCMGCHGSISAVNTLFSANAVDNSLMNNGSPYYGHPYGPSTTYNSIASGVATYTTSVGNLQFTVPLNTVEAYNTQGGIQFGSGGLLMCTTCHDVHYGQANSKAIAVLMASQTTVCNACHNGSELADIQDTSESGTGEGANAHHRTTTNTITSSTYTPTVDSNPLFLNLNWYGATPLYWQMGSLADGLQCADCHQFKGTAHTW